MPVRTAISVLHSTFDLFRELGGGVALGFNVREITRRLYLVRAEAPEAWSGDVALRAVQMRARAAHYASHYAPGDAGNVARLDELVRAYSEMLMHLEAQLERDPGCTHGDVPPPQA